MISGYPSHCGPLLEPYLPQPILHLCGRLEAQDPRSTGRYDRGTLPPSYSGQSSTRVLFGLRRRISPSAIRPGESFQ